MPANQVVDALESGNNALQSAIACVTIGTATVEFLNRPICGIATIIDRNNDNIHNRFAIWKGVQIYDQQPFDLFSRQTKFVHAE